jgi:hypothetical protein
MISKFIEYTIKKGKHYCSNLFRLKLYLWKSKLSYNVIFTESCKYDLPYPQSLAVNKLFGLSYGYHHNNSTRFGWHYNYGQIQLFAYCYVNKVRKESFICALNIGETYKLSILKTRDKYFFAVSGQGVLAQKSIIHNKTINMGYQLFPYFGGTEVAPQDIKILLQKNEK